MSVPSIQRYEFYECFVQVVASASGDGLVKLWSLADFTCIKTLEGHGTSVLKIAFLTNATQIVSTFAHICMHTIFLFLFFLCVGIHEQLKSNELK